MTKIKNFRITFRSREIARRLKAQKQIPITPSLEGGILRAIQEFRPLVKAASIYTTLTRATADKMTALPLPKSAVAVSVIAVTISDALSKMETLPLLECEGVDAEAWREAIEHEALQQSIQFSMRLLQDQAKDESCALSAPLAVPDPVQLPALAALLGVARIGIEMEGPESALPAFARMVWSFWTPLGKPSKRGEPQTRAAESAAV